MTPHSVVWLFSKWECSSTDGPLSLQVPCDMQVGQFVTIRSITATGVMSFLYFDSNGTLILRSLRCGFIVIARLVTSLLCMYSSFSISYQWLLYSFHPFRRLLRPQSIFFFLLTSSESAPQKPRLSSFRCRIVLPQRSSTSCYASLFLVGCSLSIYDSHFDLIP